MSEAGLNGMVSCQTQRNFCPSPIAVNTMADALWNRNADDDACLSRHYQNAYGSMDPQVRAYLETPSALMDSAYLRGEMPRVSEDMRHRFEQAEAHIRAFQPIVEDWLMHHPEEIPARRRSFEILQMHASLWLPLCKALRARAAGNVEEMEVYWQETLAYAQKAEKAFQDVFDLSMFRSVLEESMRREA